MEVNWLQRRELVTMSSELEQVRMQSVMCHAMLMHYVETHWEPIGQLFSQIGALSSCGIIPPTGRCKCHVINELDVSQGEVGPNSPASLPLLKSVSSSSIDSVYHSTFLSAALVSSPIAMTEGFSDCIFVLSGESTSLAALYPWSQETCDHLKKLSKENSLISALQEFWYLVLRDDLQEAVDRMRWVLLQEGVELEYNVFGCSYCKVVDGRFQYCPRSVHHPHDVLMMFL